MKTTVILANNPSWCRLIHTVNEILHILVTFCNNYSLNYKTPLCTQLRKFQCTVAESAKNA